MEGVKVGILNLTGLEGELDSRDWQQLHCSAAVTSTGPPIKF